MAGFKTYANAGVNTQGSSGFAPVTSPSGGSSSSGPGGFHPTVLYMVALIAVEIAIVAWLSKHL